MKDLHLERTGVAAVRLDKGGANRIRAAARDRFGAAAQSLAAVRDRSMNRSGLSGHGWPAPSW